MGEKNNNTSSNTLRNNIFMLYIMQMATYVFPYITFPYLTRVLGPATYGTVAMSNAFIVYFQLLVDFGFILSATQQIALHRDNKRKIEGILGSVIISKFFLAFFGYFILFLAVQHIPQLKVEFVYLSLAYIPVFLSVLIPDFLFRGLEKMRVITARYATMKMVTTVLVFVFIKDETHYLLIPAINASGSVIAIVTSWIYIIRNMKLFPKFGKIRTHIDTLTASLPFFASRIASTVYGASNVFILGLFIPIASVANFSISNQLVQVARSACVPISDSLYPYMMARRDYKVVKKILLVFEPLAVVGSIIIYLHAERIVGLVAGPEYSMAVPILRTLTPILIMTLPIYLLGYPVLGAMGYGNKANLTVVFASVFHFIAIGVLIMTDNISVLNIARITVFSEATMLLSRIYYILKYADKAINSRKVVEL